MRTMLRRLPVAMLCLLVTGVIAASGRLAVRYVHVAAASAAPATSIAAGSDGRKPCAPSRLETTLTYTSLDAPGAGEATADVTWDDAWFTQDDAVYNHDLARASSVLAALAYSESGYYQTSSDQPPYMERALERLGFPEVDTESYRFRSQVVDEVLNLVTSDADGVAYTIARKRVADTAGAGSATCAVVAGAAGAAGDTLGAHGVAEASPSAAARDIIVVSVRGSYGSEWLSNLDLSRDEGGDHGGYVRAAHEIAEELKGWVDASRLDGADVSVLLVGHSRGGAVANLVAAELDDARAAAPGAIDHLYAYTFASPATTLADDARDARYGNIFNIANPADIMPSLPLSSWGYARYGVDIALPTEGDDGFIALEARMRGLYEGSVGVECAADARDAQVVDSVVSEIASGVGSVEELVTPRGAVEVVRSVALRVNPVRILYSHYPSTYICWMQVLDEGDLRRSA